MIPNNMREKRKMRAMKLPKNIERLYKEGKCRECAVVVTRMDFARILGKFTKVKIQYESSTTPNETRSPPTVKSRLKNHENGLIQTKSKPNKEKLANKKIKVDGKVTNSPNILKEDNRLKKTLGNKSCINNNKIHDSVKQYRIIFENPVNVNKDTKSKLTLLELLPHIDSNVFPSGDWLLDYFPKTDEPKDDKVYDRIAAELEDLMYNEKKKVIKDDEPQQTENKSDEFPTIMDILNDNINDTSKRDDQVSTPFKSSLESCDVEAMLLGKPNNTNATSEPTPMDVETSSTSDVNNLLTSDEHGTVENELKNVLVENIDNPHSPSILDETLQKGIEEHLPPGGITSTECIETKHVSVDRDLNEDKAAHDDSSATNVSDDSELSKDEKKTLFPLTGVEELIFKKTINGQCSKTVICPKNLKYSILLDGKPVEFLGAPKYISSLEDLQVLLQIVDETELQNLYVLH